MDKDSKHESKAYTNRLYFLQALVLILLSGAGAKVMAKEPAIEGYDPVAYFTMTEAKKGMDSISHKWLGETWLFVSEDHKSRFIAEPMKYMPNYGGYCSYDPVSAGHNHKVDPTAWRIVDDKLYLFRSETTADHAIPTEVWEKVKAGLPQ